MEKCKKNDEYAISTPEDIPFVKMVYEVCNFDSKKVGVKKSASFLTDTSVLKPWFNNVTTIMLGTGEPEMAHQTDEFYYVEKIEESLKIYKKIISKSGEKI